MKWHDLPTSEKVALGSGALCALILLLVLIFGRPTKSPRLPAVVHTHTVTFTCSRTCTDYHQIPEVFPWQQ